MTLPIASADGQGTAFIDALFTATTSVCVTGLIVVDTFSHWSLFGKIVILVLIQLGGLGIVTVTTSLLMVIGKKVTLKNSLLLGDAFNLDTLNGLSRFLKKVVVGTFFVECVGAILCCFVFVPKYGMSEGIFVSFFHAISSFCNAGMDILGGNGFYDYSSNPYILTITMLLIVLGGLGFVVWWDLLRVVKMIKRKECKWNSYFERLTLHTKIVLLFTVVFVFGGALLIFILEYGNESTIGNMDFVSKVYNALFQSVTLRTAGFASVNQKSLLDATVLACVFLMFVGGSPIGTAGGIKTTTIAILIIATVSVIKGREEAVAFRRRIPLHTVRKALAVTLISFFMTVTISVLLLMTQKGDFIDVLYETVSAMATVGLSRNFTGDLNVFGKVLIIIAMFLGRIGPISIAIALNFSKKSRTLQFAEEDVRVG